MVHVSMGRRERQWIETYEILLSIRAPQRVRISMRALHASQALYMRGQCSNFICIISWVAFHFYLGGAVSNCTISRISERVFSITERACSVWSLCTDGSTSGIRRLMGTTMCLFEQLECYEIQL
ncbi:hypothetical protein F1559_001453 [Cyanidiococcus yangmingshanensis]|uniref:Uncharacterized protein n=1 Tax=Cyanidiococcus yangmingshanensis TaxID=2690220 RepID=A0A7J7IH12_9RHOD|nr:hypothetical protein F1559_001453 [Cyanidiococcus yangmingshanensis]